ncbi:uncharacterized protein LOC125042146 [Penaeus chinensis]|uniref:uncharacterized protein LOC125042146 n=1 Tax=Penaeus chinensis TaxID=139456 RepID=UPI001FB80D75|nr:uncharacterized protein LOC125042146 [Penaeus chinensis]
MGLGLRCSVVLVLSIARVSSSVCPTFKNLHADNLMCEPNCLDPSKGNVYGTLDYHEDSHVCLAALHASVISEMGGSVSVKRSGQAIRDFYGTVRNRIKSETRMDADSRPYAVRGPGGITAEDLLPDVLLVHNSYADTDLHVACFSQDPGYELATGLTRWDYSKNMGSKRVERQPQRTVFTFDDGPNYHAFVCQGRRAPTDVLAVVQFRLDNPGYHKPTYQAPYKFYISKTKFA